MEKLGYKTLQKKLKELKSELYNAIFSPPPDADHQLLVAEIEKRLQFVTKLLTAELASSSPTNLSSQGHRHLLHIVKSIEDLEFDFNEWKNHREITRSSDLPNSICSCDDDSDSEDDASNVRSASVTGDRDSLDLTEGLVDVDVELEPETSVEHGGGCCEYGGATASEMGGGKMVSYFGGLMTGMVFGMILMGWAMGIDDIRLPLYPTQHHAYLFPT